MVVVSLLLCDRVPHIYDIFNVKVLVKTATSNNSIVPLGIYNSSYNDLLCLALYRTAAWHRILICRVDIPCLLSKCLILHGAS